MAEPRARDESGTGGNADDLSRSSRLERAVAGLVSSVPEVEAASVVSFDGLPMASALPAGMNEDRVAAMSAALLSLGERAAEGLGRGELNQVYIEGDNGTVFLVSADGEAVLVAVAARRAKIGMMLYEVRRTAEEIGAVLRAEESEVSPAEAVHVAAPAPAAAPAPYPAPVAAPQLTSLPTTSLPTTAAPASEPVVPLQAVASSDADAHADVARPGGETPDSWGYYNAGTPTSDSSWA